MRNLGKRHKNALSGQLTLDGHDDADASAFRSTPYPPVKRLLQYYPELASMIAVEPCAGVGDIVLAWQMACRQLDLRARRFREVVELRDESDALHGLAESVLSPQDVTTITEPRAHIELAVTNLPWPTTTDKVIEGIWRAYPNAHLWALLTADYAMDGKRPTWFAQHLPEHIWRWPGRITFGSAKGGYPKPVNWVHWLPGGRRGAGHWDIMLPIDGIRDTQPPKEPTP
jgi:hypothetical protein